MLPSVVVKFIIKKPLALELGDRIVVRIHHWIGDALLATPALRALRETFPETEIHVVAKPWVSPVLRCNPHIDKIIHYDRSGMNLQILDVFRLAWQLRTGRYKAAIILRHSFEGALSTILAGIPRRIGYGTDHRGWMLTHEAKVNYAETRVHRVLDDLRLLEGFQITGSSDKLELQLAGSWVRKATKTLSSLGIPAGARLLGVSPGSKGAIEKRWYPERFAEIIRRAKDEFGVQCLLFGAKFESELAEEVRLLAGETNVYNLAGRTSLGESLALVGLCGQFLTNDSGLMHAAAALDVPLAAVFGPTDFRRTAPWSDSSVMIREELDCYNCRAEFCPFGHRCMRELGVEKVWRKILTLTRKHPILNVAERKELLPIGFPVEVDDRLTASRQLTDYRNNSLTQEKKSKLRALRSHRRDG